jgi:hypothetical protein
MTYSKIHQSFSERLEQPEALTNPEKYLGPNYQDVLNFWIYLDTLSNEEKGEMNDLYWDLADWDLDDNVHYFAWVAAMDAAAEVIGVEFSDAACLAAWDITGWGVFGWATWELIGHHKLLEQNKILTSLPLTIKKPSSLKRFLKRLIDYLTKTKK